MIEKYRNRARDAQLAGDRVQTEYYLQFADHYFRVASDFRARQEEKAAANGQERSPDRGREIRGVEDFDGHDDTDGDIDTDDGNTGDERTDRNERRSEERRVGQEGDSTGRSRGSPETLKTKSNKHHNTQV